MRNTPEGVNDFASAGQYHIIECTKYRHSGNDRPCICNQPETAALRLIGQVYVSRIDSLMSNYWRIDSVDGEMIVVTRVGYTDGSGNYVTVYPEADDTHRWNICGLGNMRRMETHETERTLDDEIFALLQRRPGLDLRQLAQITEIKQGSSDNPLASPLNQTLKRMRDAGRIRTNNQWGDPRFFVVA